MNKVYIYKGSKIGFESFLNNKLEGKGFTLFLKEIYQTDNNRSINLNLQISDERTDEEIQERVKVAKEALKGEGEETDVVIFAALLVALLVACGGSSAPATPVVETPAPVEDVAYPVISATVEHYFDPELESELEINNSKRIGISKAKEYELRFTVGGSGFLSR